VILHGHQFGHLAVIGFLGHVEDLAGMLEKAELAAEVKVDRGRADLVGIERLDDDFTGFDEAQDLWTSEDTHERSTPISLPQASGGGGRLGKMRSHQAATCKR